MNARRLLPLLLAAPLATAAPAAADTFHAHPGGFGSVCSTEQPCSLPTALGKVDGSDVVRLAGGTYFQSESIVLDETQTLLAGEPGGARPVLDFGANVGKSLTATGSDVTVRDVDVRGTADNSTLMTVDGEAAAERVRVHYSGTTTNNSGSACLLRGSARLLDSTCVATGDGISAVTVHSTPGGTDATITGVTAVARGAMKFGSLPAAGVLMSAVNGHPAVHAEVANTIARSAAGRDVAARNSSGAGSPAAHLDVANSMFRTTSTVGQVLFATGDAGGNVKGAAADPHFTDETAGDLRPAPYSLAVDGGRDDVLHTDTDLAGNPRIRGARIDMGAYEAALRRQPAPSSQPQPPLPAQTTPQPPVQQPATPRATLPTVGVKKLRVLALKLSGRKLVFRLSTAAEVTIKVKKGRKVVRRIVTTRKAGTQTVKLPKRLAAGRYRVEVRARAADGQATRAAKAIRLKKRR